MGSKVPSGVQSDISTSRQGRGHLSSPEPAPRKHGGSDVLLLTLVSAVTDAPLPAGEGADIPTTQTSQGYHNSQTRPVGLSKT